MKYESLNKIYYKNPEQHSEIYKARFNSPTTRHFDFSIKQFGRRKNYPAFLCYTEELVLFMEKIYNKQAKFPRLTEQVPQLLMRQFELMSVVDEVKSTSDIEGVHSTRQELKEIVEGEKNSPHFSSIIKKYITLTSNEILSFKNCDDVRKFYDEFAHQEITLNEPNKKLDGKIFRKGSVDIQTGTGKILHRGVYSEEKIIELMTKALKILNDEKIPALIRIAAFHYFFEYIHPFYDGNGRTARFIASYYLAEHLNYLTALRLSVIIKRQRKKYYDLFEETDSEFNCGDLTPFVYGFISIVANTFDDIENNLNRKTKQLIKYREKILDLVRGDELTLKIYDILLQSTLFFGQGVSMEEIIKLTNKSRNTIKSRIETIPKGHIIRTGSKKYFYKLNMKIFYDGDNFKKYVVI